MDAVNWNGSRQTVECSYICMGVWLRCFSDFCTFNALFFSPLFPLFLHWCSSCSYRLTRELVAWFTMVIVNVVSLVLLMLQGWWYRCYGSVALIFNMYLQLYKIHHLPFITCIFWSIWYEHVMGQTLRSRLWWKYQLLKIQQERYDYKC